MLLKNVFSKQDCNVFLDGDNVRSGINSDLGFTEAGEKKISEEFQKLQTLC